LKSTNNKFKQLIILGGAIGVILAGVGLYQVLGSQVLQSKSAAQEQPIALSEIKTVILYWNDLLTKLI
jgi:succinate-acetate transporter protein